MSVTAHRQNVLAEPEWRARQAAHHVRVEPWIAPRRQRRATGAKHPVDDFLFEYYPYSLNKLRTWHPGLGVVLAGDASEFRNRPDYITTDGGVTLDATGLEAKRDRLDLVITLLKGTASRSPQLGCFGLHEWAMVYRQDPQDVRHNAYELRLTPEQIEATVEEIGLRCTHIDAYRFFTPQAAPLNAHEPTRATQPDLEQPGCLHANMDLYKYAMWFSPFIPSELVADCFDLARQARELDMRASPYDLDALGYEPITVETPEGRRAYVAEQRRIIDRADDLRTRLTTVLADLSDRYLA